LLASEQVKAFISHEDRFVRELAAEHFTNGRLADPEAPHLILAAAREHVDPHLLIDLKKLPLDGAALAAVADRAAEGRKGEYRHLSDAILWSPISSQITNRERIASALADDKELVEKVEARCGLAQRSPEELWRLLDLAGRQPDEAPENEPCLVSFMDRAHEHLVDVLAPLDYPDEETVVRLLQDEGTLEFALNMDLITLAARRGYVRAIPPVLEQIPDDDWLNETVLDWYPLYRSPEVMTTILENWDASGFFYRPTAAEVVGRMRLPESEEHLLRLLECEEDGDIREMILMELAALFSEAAIEPMIDEARHERSGMTVVWVPDILLPLADALGVELPPEADEWRRERDRREARRRWLATGGGPVPEDIARERAEAERHREIQEAMRNRGPRIGRNQPCPCGSGKKYKRCCGRK